MAVTCDLESRMAIPLFKFRWVCDSDFEAYLCPANAIFPQLELIETLLRQFERGPVSVSFYTAVAQATGNTYNWEESFLGSPVHFTVEERLPVV